MQRRKFLKASAILSILPFIDSSASTLRRKSEKKEIYEWRIYTLKENGDKLDSFFRDTLIPAYSRHKIRIGAFQPYKKEGDDLRYLLLVYPDITTFHKVKKEIWKDKTFLATAQPFYDQTAPNPLYSGFQTFLCEAFDSIPVMKEPDGSRTLFELRVYWSPNEEANRRKVEMFNKDEISVFDKVGINSVCYGDILAGPVMPALMYLTWYKDETARNAAWSAFGKHPDWIRIRDMKEYAHTATNNKSYLLSPLPFSQI